MTVKEAGKRGGKARAAALHSKRRKEIASLGGIARALKAGQTLRNDEPQTVPQ